MGRMGVAWKKPTTLQQVTHTLLYTKECHELAIPEFNSEKIDTGEYINFPGQHAVKALQGIVEMLNNTYRIFF